MAQEEKKVSERTLEETSTWTVAVVCFVLLVISIVIEKSIHKIGTWLKQKHKKSLYEALEKVKAELMLLGFISLLLTVGQTPISKLCISEKVGSIMRPCSAAYYRKKAEEKEKKDAAKTSGKFLLELAESYIPRRSLATKGYDECAKGKVAFVSAYGIHQLHVFIFVLAVVHVIYCIVTYALGRSKMRSWKKWEDETKTIEYKYSNDPEKFRFARDTTFGRRHLSFWSKTSITLWIVCFFRQLFGSVTKVDYLALRHGFIMVYYQYIITYLSLMMKDILLTQSLFQLHFRSGNIENFDFRKYIERSLEKDYKKVVEISPVIWFFAVLFLLTNTNGLRSYLWIPFIPLLIILVVGTKLQVIITRLGLRIQDKGDVVSGAPVVQPCDDLFWFDNPSFILYLIHLVLFTNAFQLAFFAWSTYEFGLNNCFHKTTADVTIRIVVGIIVQILCSYVTLPLYALVTQMGSTMKPEVFDEKVATALKKWHHTAKKETKHGRHSESNTPTHGSSPIHLLHTEKNRSSESYHNDSDHHDHHNFWDPESQHQEAESSTHRSISEERSEHKPVPASVELTTKSSKAFSSKKSDS